MQQEAERNDLIQCYVLGLEPSVAQPPLLLHVFFPLHPLFPELQPPLPAQEFLPLQACFSFGWSAAIRPLLMEEKDLVGFVFCANALFPATIPASAAPTISDFIDFVMVICLSEINLVELP
jgi:hypothetical protein